MLQLVLFAKLMSSLTADQLKRCEENRKRALQIRAMKQSTGKPAVPNNCCNGANSSNSVASTSSLFRISSTSSNHQTKIQTVKVSEEQNLSKPKITWASGPTFGHQNKTETAKISIEPTLNKPEANWTTGKQVVGSCHLVSRERFQVEMDYHQKTIEVFKKISSRSYDAVTKRWSFHIKDHDALISDMKIVQSAIIGGLPKHVLDIFRNAQKSKTIPEADLSTLDPTLSEALMPFQRVGVSFGIQNKGRVMIADDMGLGKTIQAIAISAHYMSEWPLLVVTPSSVRYAWEEAFHLWLPSVKASEISVINTQRDKALSGKVVILSYDMLSRKEKDIMNVNFRVVIFDESHFLKSFKSVRTKAAQGIVKHSNRVILLSGTPALSRPSELYTQIYMINPKLFPSYPAFGLRYCAGKQMPWGWDYSGSSNMAELQLVLEEQVLIRRLKSEVLNELPAKQRQMILLDPTQIAGKMKSMEELSRQMSNKSLVGMERRGVLLQFYHSTGIAKIPAICNYIEELLEADKKFLCFAHHQQVLDAICDRVYQKKYDYIRIDGSTSSENRKLYCDKFQFHDSCKVAVLSITAANAGINLTAAHLVVFAELFWNPGILTQAEDRAHRIGQQDCVIVQYLVARGTADDYIWPMVQKKLDTLSKAGLSKDNFSNADTICSSDKNTKMQKTIDAFFEKMNAENDGNIFLDCEDLDLFQHVDEKKMKYS